MKNPVKIDTWAAALLVDPISKGELMFDESQKKVFSNYGKSYSITDGIYDFRPYQYYASRDAVTWANGQQEYEGWSEDLNAIDNENSYRQELADVTDVYENIPLKGDVLDVGGHQGRLRAFLPESQNYMIVDPYMRVFDGLDQQQSLLNVYPFLRSPVNFVCGVAEHLPLRTCSFDTVHMRSVIDHFQNPELALLEAYRVLRKDGQLIIGLYVEGGLNGKISFFQKAKELVKSCLAFLGINRWKDHHVWHPTYLELEDLIKHSGFTIKQIYWQKAYADKVCYVQAIKP